MTDLQYAQQGEKPHPACFADIPLLQKGEGMSTSPYCPSPSQGEGCFGESQNRVKSCHDAKCHSEHSEESSADVKAARRSVGQSGDGKPHPLVPLLQQGEGRFGGSRNRVRSGQVGEKQQAQQGERPHPVCFADIPLLHKGEGIATSPCCPSPSTRRGTFWR